ncbi:hypothetical protein IGJ02_003085 [Enterococcus sp. DIV0724b]|uniref:winged helix-turn-helix domain-containing protein n=1 Tax=Enterococcus sp. DIV0724b TaxID=2774694 RepID=UPI003D2FA3B9
MYKIKYFKNTEKSRNNEVLIKEMNSQRIDIVIKQDFNYFDMYQDIDVFLIDENELMQEKIFESIIFLKKNTNALIWLLSDSSIQAVRITYLRLGVDMIVSNNIHDEELSIELSNMLTHRAKKTVEKMGIKNSYFLLTENRTFRLCNGEEVPLTPLEYKLMHLLIQNKNRLVTYENTILNLWGTSKLNKLYMVSNIIFHLREKIEKRTGTKFIKTMRSSGYMLVNENCFEISVDKLDSFE